MITVISYGVYRNTVSFRFSWSSLVAKGIIAGSSSLDSVASSSKLVLLIILRLYISP